MEDKEYGLFEQEIVEEWINGDKLKRYMESHFEKWAFFNNGSYSEIFINDEELNDYCDPEQLGYEELFYIVDSVIKDMGYEDNNGEDVSWVADKVQEGTLVIYPFSQMFKLEEVDIEIVDGEILRCEGDKGTLQEIINIKNA